MARILGCSCLLLLLATGTSAQIIKKAPKRPPTRLDSVYLEEEHFRMETLDSVYRYIARRFRVSLVYDTIYARRHYHSYWYMHTPVARAIEITTREQRLSYKIDSLGNVIIARRSLLPEDTITERPPAQIKYAGPATRRHFTLTGRVIDFISGEPLDQVTLKIAGTGQQVLTASDGFFSIPDVSSDTVTIETFRIGYEPASLYLNPEVASNNFIVELMPDSNTTRLHETVVIASREVMQQSTTQISTIKLSPAKLAELPNVGEKDIMRALQLMPGVSAANESSSGLYVRGGTPDQNLVLYDGFAVYHVDHLYGFFSAFNANALKDVQLYKGGFDANFGGRLSSVTEISGREGNPKKFNLGGDISLLSGNIFTEIPLSEKITITAAWRRSWKGPIYNWIFDKFSNTSSDASQSATGGPGGATTETSSYFTDLNTRVTYRPTAKDNVSYSFFSSTDKLTRTQTVNFRGGPGGFGGGGGFGGSNGATDYTRYANRGMSLQWQRKWSNKLSSHTVVSFSQYKSNRDRTNERVSVDTATEATTSVKTGVLENNHLQDLSFKTQADIQLFKGNKLSLGGFASYYDIRYTYSKDDTSTILDRSDIGVLAGGFLQDHYLLANEHIDLGAGLRYSYFDVTGKTYTEPRLSGSFRLGNFSLKTAWGKYYQFVNQVTREDVLNGNTDFWILSDKSNVPVAQSTHYIAGLSYDSKKYTFSAEAYYKLLKDITQYSLRFSSVFNSRTYSESFYVGKGYSKGIELMAQKKTGRLTGWVSYTLGEAYNQFDVYGPDYVPANQNVTHEFKAVGIYKYRKWDFSANWIFATGRPYTAPGGSYNVTLLDGTSKSYFTVTAQNSLRLPDYHRLDLAVNRHFYNDHGKEIGYIGLSVFNAYNHTNIWYKQFYITDNQITEVNVNYLGLTPNLTLSLKIR